MELNYMKYHYYAVFEKDEANEVLKIEE